MSTAACARAASLGPLLALAACGGGYEPYDTGYRTAPTGTGTGTATTTPPPETEGAFAELPPAQTDAYVFVANPDRDTVSRITVADLSVITTPVGADPRRVVTTPDHRFAVALNRGDDSLSILDAHSLAQQVVPIRDELNQLVVSPDSRWIVAWRDQAAVNPNDPAPDGLQSFGEASFVDLATGAHTGLAVGFNPRDVVFTPDGELAVVVTDTHLALIDLTATPLVPVLVSLSDALEPPEAEEVVLAPDGRHAFVRQFGATEVLVVDLLGRSVRAVPIGTNPTDLDLSPDGTVAVAVARASEELWVLDAIDPENPPTTIALPAGQAYGAIAFDPTGARAILYTTALPVDRYALWVPSTGAITEHGLTKPISGVTIAPDGEHALFFHPTTNAPGADPSGPFYDRHAVSIVVLDIDYQNPLLLPAQPTAASYADSGRYAYFAMEGQKFLEVVDLATRMPDQIPLKSVPVHLGVLPGAGEPVAWVSQDHDLGRISFWTQATGELQTITGFELNSGIERE